MSNKDKLIKSTVAAFLALSTTNIAFSASPAATDTSTEKCYGIAKAGSNDCATATSSCAGSATKDNQSDAFLLLPKGLCDRIAGGRLDPNSK
jgi:uncharacterized membrane protein